MSVAIAIFLWIFGCFVLAELLPLVGMAIGWVVEKLIAVVVRMVSGLLWGFRQAAVWITRQAWLGCRIAATWTARNVWLLCCKTVRGLWEVLVFLYFLADEALHPGRKTDDETVGDSEAPPREEPPRNLYMQAIGVLGLSPGFTQEQFNRAYKRAIAKAHPDKGGTHEQALAVNAARATILAAHDWRR